MLLGLIIIVSSSLLQHRCWVPPPPPEEEAPYYCNSRLIFCWSLNEKSHSCFLDREIHEFEGLKLNPIRDFLVEKQRERMERVVFIALFSLLLASAVAHSGNVVKGVTYDGRSLIVNGRRELLFSGSIHYPRSPPEVL